MATTKTVTSIWSAVTNSAGGTTTSSAASLLTGYGAVINIKLTNGATAPSSAGAISVLVSADNTNYYTRGGLLNGSYQNSGVTAWEVRIPAAVKYVKLQATNNNDQSVTLDADITEVTAI